MDPCVEAPWNLAVSRLFPVCAGRISPGITHRPGYLPIDEQVRQIPPGVYVLRDDDIVTGGTMRRVQERLPTGISVSRYCALTQRERESVFILDILDCRDFLAGAREGGLVVEIPDGSLARAPYSLPYVSPSHGASTPLSRELEVSRAIWLLNKQFFAAIQPAITLTETSVGFRNLMGFLGFNKTSSMEEIAAWHTDRSLGFGVGAPV